MTYTAFAGSFKGASPRSIMTRTRGRGKPVSGNASGLHNRGSQTVDGRDDGLKRVADAHRPTGAVLGITQLGLPCDTGGPVPPPRFPTVSGGQAWFAARPPRSGPVRDRHRHRAGNPVDPERAPVLAGQRRRVCWRARLGYPRRREPADQRIPTGSSEATVVMFDNLAVLAFTGDARRGR